MTLPKAEARANETFIVQASLAIITYDRHYRHLRSSNIFIVQATGLNGKK